MPHRLNRSQQALASARVLRESPQPVAELAALAGASAATVERWIVEGAGGLHLDGLFRPGEGWLSSRAAVERFLAARAGAG